MIEEKTAVPNFSSIRSGLKKTAMKEGADTPIGHGASNMLELTELLEKGVEGEQRRQVLASLDRQQGGSRKSVSRSGEQGQVGMSKRYPGIKGYVKAHVERGETMFLVGAEDPSSSYKGPEATVTWDDVWLNIETDPYEGHAMINIEALEPLRKALAKISRARKSSALGQGERS